MNIFDFVVRARDTYCPGVALRVCGGWVRDRLMSRRSDDIDIAVSGGDGVKLAHAVVRLDEELGCGRTKGSFAVSLEKGGDSQGLMVGAVILDGLKVEFVPMRTERYGDDSRIPVIVATDDPKEDALRRDLTVNAVYYNLDTEEVEDYVGGCEDIKQGILRTPVDPIKTLQDDPLRAVRVLRFMSQLGFKPEPGLVAALADPSVHAAWERKVAPNRVRKELEGVALGANPDKAFRLLLESGLYIPMFGRKRFDGLKPVTMDQNNPHHDQNLLDHTVGVVEHMGRLMVQHGYGDEARMLAVLAALFHDFGKMVPGIEVPSKTVPGASSYPGHEDASADMAEEILKELGFGSERLLVCKIIREHMRPHGGIDTDKAAGRFLRDFERLQTDHGLKDSLWRITILHGMADCMAKGGGGDSTELAARLLRMDAIQRIVDARGKDVKPLLSGRDLMILFPDRDPKSGFIKEMTKVIEEARDEGIIVDAESAKAYLLASTNIERVTR